MEATNAAARLHAILERASEALQRPGHKGQPIDIWTYAFDVRSKTDAHIEVLSRL